MGVITYAVIIASLLSLSWLGFKIMKNSKKDKANKPPKQEKKEEISDPSTQSLTTNNIRVLIFRAMSKDLVAQVGGPIICSEKPDSNNNLVVINEDKKFKEDFSFSIDRVYEVMNFNLELQNKTKVEKAIILNNKIKEQEKLVVDIDSDVSKNADYNYQDENLKLSQLKVLRDALKKENTGNYMRMMQGGVRQYELVAIDGVLYPYFFGSNWYRVYPDLLVKKKIFNHENSVFRNETAALLNKALNWMMIIGLLIGAVLTIANLFAGLHLYDKNAELSLIANQGALTCASSIAEIERVYGESVKEYLAYRQGQTQSNINTETPSTNIIGNIIVDPSKITG